VDTGFRCFFFFQAEDGIRDFHVTGVQTCALPISIEGPLTTPVGGGIRPLNVALRQQLDLYVCQRPVRWFTGVPSPVKNPGDVDRSEERRVGKECRGRWWA